LGGREFHWALLLFGKLDAIASKPIEYMTMKIATNATPHTYSVLLRMEPWVNTLGKTNVQTKIVFNIPTLFKIIADEMETGLWLRLNRSASLLIKYTPVVVQRISAKKTSIKSEAGIIRMQMTNKEKDPKSNNSPFIP